MSNLIKLRLNLAGVKIYGLKALFESKPSVSRREFTDYVQISNIFGEYKGISAASFIEAVPDAKLEDFIRQTKMDKSEDSYPAETFAISPEGERDIYYVIKYASVRDRTAQAIGLDVGTFPDRLSVIERARDTGLMTLTNLVSLQGSFGGQKGIIMYLPVYDREISVNTVELRRSAFTGVVALIIPTDEFFAAILNDNEEAMGVDFNVYKGPNIVSENLIYDGHPQLTPLEKPEFSVQNTITNFDKSWTVKFMSLPSFKLTDNDDKIPLIVLIVSADLTLLFTAVVFFSIRSQVNALNLANEMIERLKVHDREHSHTRVKKFK